MTNDNESVLTPELLALVERASRGEPLTDGDVLELEVWVTLLSVGPVYMHVDAMTRLTEAATKGVLSDAEADRMAWHAQCLSEVGPRDAVRNRTRFLIASQPS